VFSLRGKETIVICESCGRKVPRNKAIVFEKAISFSTDLKTTNDVRFFEKRKVYYCISCAKHRGIFEKKKRQAIERSKKLM
jgi:ribosomal protein S26